jgi:putative membrane protein
MENQSLMVNLVHWCVSAVALMMTAYLVPGFKVKSFTSALIAALVIGLANLIVWPILMVLTLPLNILTLGLFTFVVNAIVLRLCASMLSGFEIDSWISAIIGAFILAIVGTGLHYMLA